MWIRKGVEARRTRSVGRIARLVQMRNERAERNTLGNVKLDVAQGEIRQDRRGADRRDEALRTAARSSIVSRRR